MRQVFRDPVLDERYQRDGYVVLPLLDASGVAELSRRYEAFPAPSSTGFHVSMHGEDAEVRRGVSAAVREILAPPVLARMEGMRACTGNFVVKEAAAEDSTVPVHQDWTMVDETEACSVNVWCPLVDTTVENGALHVFPGSHRFVPTLRGPFVATPFARHAEAIRARHLVPVPVRAGEAVLFDHGLVHYSPPNRGAHRRLVANLTVVPEDAVVLHCHREPCGCAVEPPVQVFEVDDDFFVRHRIGNVPEGRLRATVDYDPPALDEAELDRLAAAWAAGAPPTLATEVPMS